MATHRALHWTDTIHEGARRRTIQNWANYRTPAGVWAAANVDVAERSDAPSDWSGAYDFTHAQLGSALQSFVGDSTDPSNTALWGMRLSDRPGAWLNFKAVGIDNASAPVVDRAERTATWVELWNNVDLRLTIGRHKVAKDLVLKTPAHQAAFRFALRYPQGFTHEIVGGMLRLLDGQGVEVMRSRPAQAFDVAGSPVRVALVAGAPITVGGRTFPTVRVVPNATDLASAQYPVTVDPTTTISGTAAIDDAHMRPGSRANNNYGATTNLVTQAVNFTSLYRCASASIPAGTLTAARLKCRARAQPLATDEIAFYRIAQANAWVEGTANGASQTGSCCWNYTRYNTVAWAGSAGCQTATTDYETNPSPPVLSCYDDTYTPYTVTLVAAWFTDWRDGTWANQGMVTRLWSGTEVEIYSTELAGNEPYFEVDYSAAAAGAPVAMASYRRRRS